MLLYGGGDHAASLVEIIQLLGLEWKGFFDDGEGPYALPLAYHLGPYEPTILPDVPILLAITDNTIRRNLALRIRHPVADPLIHPRAYVAASARLGKGTVVLAGALIHSHAQIGDHTIINTGSVVEHFTRVGSFCHLSPGSIVACRSQIEDFCFIGTGAIIVPHTQIGEGCVIGAGSLVLRSLPPYTRAWGHPAKPQEELPHR
ncbi:MAG: NeuD/PglB/VioB family sugar acetyltransferase [Bacteroidia bacterium]